MAAIVKPFVEPEDAVADSLKILWYARLHPALNSKLTTFFVYFNIAQCLVYVVLAIKGIFTHKTDLIFVVDCIQTCILVTHTIVKFFVLHNQKAILLSLLEKKTKFWKIADVADYALYTECSNIFSTVRKLVRIFFIQIMLAAFVFDLQPFTTGDLPSQCYVPEGWYYYLAVSMWFMSYVMGTSISGTDCLFCSLGSALVVQFKLLAYKLKNMKASSGNKYQQNVWNGLQTLVDYHVFLLNYCAELNAAFKSLFLLQFGITIASSSVSVLIFMRPGSLAHRIKFLLYFAALIIEMGFYCVPVEVVINTAQTVDDAVYESDWYNINVKEFKNCLTMIMRRAQKPISFNGYGLLDINLQTYVWICKTVFSFYTYLNSMQKLGDK